MTRRAVLATLAASALTACSGSTVVASTSSGGTDDAGTDDAGTHTDAEADASTDTGVVSNCGDAAVGAVASFPVGTWTSSGDFIVGHDQSGLFAFSTRCTHQGCTVGTASRTTGATQCPCHGARFDGNGAVVAGPARTPLPHFALSVCDGMVYVDKTMTVVAATRTPAA